jgi:hypothetical protein
MLGCRQGSLLVIVSLVAGGLGVGAGTPRLQGLPSRENRGNTRCDRRPDSYVHDANLARTLPGSGVLNLTTSVIVGPTTYVT